MEIKDRKQLLLRSLPGVDHIIELTKADDYLKTVPRTVLTRSIRDVIENLRTEILKNPDNVSQETLTDAFMLNMVKAFSQKILAPNLVRTINATGVVVHTNLGRSILAEDALENIHLIASRYSNLEFDLAGGKRGSRYSAVEDILCEISGAEAAMVVNNNAGAVLLCLETIARDKKVIISRGELVEIGGSFRIPDVMPKSGGILCEV